MVLVRSGFLCRHRVSGADASLRHKRLHGQERGGEFQFTQTDAVQGGRHLGQSRRIPVAVDPYPDGVWCGGRPLRIEHSAGAESKDAVGAGLDQRWLPDFHAADVQSFRPRFPSARRRSGPQPIIAGCRSRHAPAASLLRVCWLLDCLLVCGRRPDRRAGGRGLGTVGTSVDAGCLDEPDRRHRAGILVGLL